MFQSKLLSYEYFTPKIFLLGRTQCQAFDCLYWAKRYGPPCTADILKHRGQIMLCYVQLPLLFLEHQLIATGFMLHLASEFTKITNLQGLFDLTTISSGECSLRPHLMTAFFNI